ncbi:MAG: hypothetical protein ABFD50_07960 [Smithella sp.]
MTENQAEKLANEFLKSYIGAESYKKMERVRPETLNGYRDLITQATVEMREENERLKEQVAGLVEIINVFRDIMDDATVETDNIEFEWKEFQQTETIDWIKLLPVCKLVDKIECTDFQATADAFRAKVREEAVLECIAALHADVEKEGVKEDMRSPMNYLDYEDAITCLQALINNKKGGT